MNPVFDSNVIEFVIHLSVWWWFLIRALPTCDEQALFTA
jgi:hypothetical protein